MARIRSTQACEYSRKYSCKYSRTAGPYLRVQWQVQLQPPGGMSTVARPAGWRGERRRTEQVVGDLLLDCAPLPRGELFAVGIGCSVRLLSSTTELLPPPRVLSVLGDGGKDKTRRKERAFPPPQKYGPIPVRTACCEKTFLRGEDRAGSGDNRSHFGSRGSRGDAGHHTGRRAFARQRDRTGQSGGFSRNSASTRKLKVPGGKHLEAHDVQSTQDRAYCTVTARPNGTACNREE